MSGRLADCLQIWGLENDNIIFSDGSFGLGFLLKPVDCSCWSTQQRNDYAEQLIQFLNGLPSEIDFQFVQDIKAGNAELISEHLKSDRSGQDVIKELTKVRIDKFQKLDSDGYLPRHSLMFFVRRKPNGPLLKKPSWFSKHKNFEPIAEDRLKQELAVSQRLAYDLEASLSTLGFSPTRLKASEIMAIIYKQWNPSRNVELGEIDPSYLRSSILFTDVGIDNTGFSIGEYFYRIISLKLLPDQTFASMAAKLRELPFDSRLSLTAHVPDQQKELESLQTQRRIAFSMVAGKKTGVTDLESEAKFRDLESLLEQMVAAGEKVFHMSLQVTLRSKYQEDLENKVSETLAKVREMSGAEAMEETLAAFDIFCESSVPNSRSKERNKPVKTSNLCDMLPVFGPWGGHTDPKILLRSRLGSLVSFNPFTSELTNSNQIVSGGSGSGKSFMTNILLMQMLKENPKVFIVDIGGSYKKICENLNGQYIQLGVDTALSMNPFDLASGETKPTSQKIKFILSLVEIMTKDSDQIHLGKLEKSEIESAIEQVYENSKLPRLSDLRNLLLKHPEVSIQRIGKILTSWCGNSPYGKFVDQETTLALKRPIVCFDLKGMESYPDLQSVCLFIITDFVWREVQADRSHMKFLILDECWKLMENDSASLFIAEVFRTFRKYMASAIAISQTIDDFARSKIANAILPNSSIKWVLKQKGADKERLKEVLSLNPTEVELISSLQQERGSFSEAFLMAEDARAVVAIESTPLEYWLATTDGRDLGMIDQLKVSNSELGTLEILKTLAAKYPKGIAANGVLK
jgi:conjugal transfer ATP-binding protein TraC